MVEINLCMKYTTTKLRVLDLVRMLKISDVKKMAMFYSKEYI